MKVINELISSYAKNIKMKKSSGHGKIIDSPARLLHHERPFTREGNYLVLTVLFKQQFENHANVFIHHAPPPSCWSPGSPI